MRKHESYQLFGLARIKAFPPCVVEVGTKLAGGTYTMSICASV